MEETRRESSESPSLTSFLSLPDDIILNCLARVSRIYYPTLSLVSKSFGRILSSRELYTTRTLIRKTEDILFVCLTHNKPKPPRWFALSLILKKLIPMPSFPYTRDSTVLSTGAEIYIIGGTSNRVNSERVFVLDFQSHIWRRLPDMRVARRHPAADVINGKLYVNLIAAPMAIVKGNLKQIFGVLRFRSIEAKNLAVLLNGLTMCLIMRDTTISSWILLLLCHIDQWINT